jgi:hypothetical protein
MKAGKIAEVVRAVQARYHGEVYLGWDRGYSSIAVWHEGRWLCASIWGTPEDTLGSLAEAAGEGDTQRRVQHIEDTLIRRAGGDPHKCLRGWSHRLARIRFVYQPSGTTHPQVHPGDWRNSFCYLLNHLLF